VELYNDFFDGNKAFEISTINLWT